MLLSASALLWLPLALAITAGFARYHRVSWGLLIITLLSALGSGYLTFVGAGIICVGFALAYLAANGQSHWRTTAWVALLLWCLALFLHWLPGFSNLKVLDKVIASAHSTPFSLYLNLDKPLVFFALLLAFPALLGQSKTANIKATLLTLVPLFALLPIAVWLGALAFEWSLPEWWWIFALNNLLFTCVAEEALFRGLIQQSSAAVWRHCRTFDRQCAVWYGPFCGWSITNDLRRPCGAWLWFGVPFYRASLGQCWRAFLI